MVHSSSVHPLTPASVKLLYGSKSNLWEATHPPYLHTILIFFFSIFKWFLSLFFFFIFLAWGPIEAKISKCYFSHKSILTFFSTSSEFLSPISSQSFRFFKFWHFEFLTILWIFLNIGPYGRIFSKCYSSQCQIATKSFQTSSEFLPQ